MEKGILYLIPTPLAEQAAYVLPFDASVLHKLHIFVVEEISTARRFLKRSGYPFPLDQVVFLELNEHSLPEDASAFLPYLMQGKSVGLMSEAGLPCVADPGSEAVKLAHQHHVEVIPLPGPSSIFLTLMASGANGQQFAFHGYLPIEKMNRERYIKNMEITARKEGISQIFMETPYRNKQLMESVLKHCKDDTLLCIGCDIQSGNQFIQSRTVAAWKKFDPSSIHKRPCVFILFY